MPSPWSCLRKILGRLVDEAAVEVAKQKEFLPAFSVVSLARSCGDYLAGLATGWIAAPPLLTRLTKCIDPGLRRLEAVVVLRLCSPITLPSSSCSGQDLSGALSCNSFHCTCTPSEVQLELMHRQQSTRCQALDFGFVKKRYCLVTAVFFCACVRVSSFTSILEFARSWKLPQLYAKERSFG